MPSDVSNERPDDDLPERSEAPGPKGPAPAEALSVAVIGAGISGLAAGRALHDHGLRVTVFDKGRGPGGRTSTRRREEGPYDHGAPFFSAEDPRFRSCVAEWLRAGVVGASEKRVIRWTASGQRDPEPAEGTGFSGVPGMSAICRHLARGMEVRARERIAAIAPDPRGWTVESPDAVHGPYDLVVLAIPAPQAEDLLSPLPQLADQVATVTYDPCVAALVGFATPPPLDFDVLRGEDGPLALAIRQRDDPEAPCAARWVLHASAWWSAEHLERPPDESAADLLAAFRALWPEDGPSATSVVGHRWRYARVSRRLSVECLFDPASNIGVCGDWCRGEGIEGAWLSGIALADRILGRTLDRPPSSRSEAQLKLFDDA